jgi:hypothetical protein
VRSIPSKILFLKPSIGLSEYLPLEASFLLDLIKRRVLLMGRWPQLVMNEVLSKILLRFEKYWNFLIQVIKLGAHLPRTLPVVVKVVGDRRLSI